MNIDALKTQLIAEEGLRQLPYTDSLGNQTLGVGHNMSAPISLAAVEQILSDDIMAAIGELNRTLPWWIYLSENRQMVLADMAFNMGIPKLLEFKLTLEAMRAGRYDDAAAGMLDSGWARQVGARALKLADMMRIG